MNNKEETVVNEQISLRVEHGGGNNANDISKLTHLLLPLGLAFLLVKKVLLMINFFFKFFDVI